MKKRNKDFLWLVYTVLISFVGILFLTGKMPLPGKITVHESAEEVENMEDAVAEKAEIEEKDPLSEEYYQLEGQIEELEKTLEESQEKLAREEETKFAALHEYGKQITEIKEKYRPLMNYNVKNFEAQYDTGGSKEIQDTNQIIYGIGELSKFTPWGITINMFSSMALDNSKADYEVMVDANNAFGTGMQTIIVDTKAEMEKFTARMDFYEKLTEDSENESFARFTEERVSTIWENQYLMKDMLNGSKAELEPYAEEVYKKLYIMGVATLTLKDFYRTLLTDCDSKSNSINKLQNQYEEIMEVIDPDGTGQIEEMVTEEELMHYLKPLIDAGRSASNGYAGLGSSSPLVNSTWEYTRMGTVYWHFKEDITMVNSDMIHIYYAGGKPVYVNGYYFYNGRLLNGNGSEDAEVLYDEAVWMITGYHSDKRVIESHMQNILNACGNG